MKNKKVILMLILATAGLCVFAIAAISSFSLNDVQEKIKPNSLRWYASKAKKEGTKRVVVPAPFVEYMGGDEPPDSVLPHLTVVTAQLVDGHTIISGDDTILTWQKFKILETISAGTLCEVCPNISPPAHMLPLDEDEILIPVYQGTTYIDDVAVTMQTPGLPPFSENVQYLLMLVKTPSGTANLYVGPIGVFTIDSEGTIESINNLPHPMKDVIEHRMGKSLKRFKRHLKEIQP